MDFPKQTALSESSTEQTRIAVGPDLAAVKPLPSGNVPPHSPTDSPSAAAALQNAAHTPGLDALHPALAFQPRVYEPEDIACSHQNEDLTNCGAEAGEPCKWQQPGEEGLYHAERIADAAAASQRDGAAATKEQFDQAAWDSGLF